MRCGTLWTSPQPETSVLRFNLGKVHWQLVMRTRDLRHRGNEVSGGAVVVDEAAGLRTGVGKRRSQMHFALYENVDRTHQNVMLVAKRLKLRADLDRSCTLAHNDPLGRPTRIDASHPFSRASKLGSFV